MTSEDRARELIQQANDALDRIQAYTATVICTERIAGKKLPVERIEFRFRRPNWNYMRWKAGAHEGLQVAYIPEKWGSDMVRGRETGLRGLAGGVTWPLDSKIARRLYPHHFTAPETGVVPLMNLINQIQDKAERINKLEVVSVDRLEDAFLHRPAERVVTKLSSDPADGLRWPKTELFFDTGTALPLHFVLHDFDGGLFGEYAFTEFEPHSSLDDDAFEVRKV